MKANVKRIEKRIDQILKVYSIKSSFTKDQKNKRLLEMLDSVTAAVDINLITPEEMRHLHKIIINNMGV